MRGVGNVDVPLAKKVSGLVGCEVIASEETIGGVGCEVGSIVIGCETVAGTVG